ncbi:iron-containing redox enzyme family protein [Actinomadura flavalba]|uniref:iron-containing redox enzyme family protein n=1 Tax=Actinomadura flavalba TaxID=1120938 RepID=UPI0004777B0A|nr:iron-containing redox enzyme family protein [Actinomadura flavalba]
MDDLTTSLPTAPIMAGAAAVRECAAVTEPREMFRRLVSEPESEATFLLAHRVLAAFLPEPGEAATAAELLAEAAAVRDGLAGTLDDLRGDPATLRERAAVGLLEGCWLDTLSQPATQPALIVNRLLEQHFALRGRGVPERSTAAHRRRALEERGVTLPDLDAADFLDRAGARRLTVVAACLHLALCRVPASHLPEVVGVYCAFRVLGVDGVLFGTPPGPDAAPILTEYWASAPRADRARATAAFRLVLELEAALVGMLADVAAWERALPLDGHVTRIVARHAPFAGRQHGPVRVGRRLLSDALADEDARQVVWELRDSEYLRRRDGDSPFVRATKFGGPMFGVFDEAEARTLAAWEAAVAAGEEPDFDFEPCAAGDATAARWEEALRSAAPPGVVTGGPAPADERHLFHRLVNVERFPNVLDLARDHVAEVLDQSEALFTVGARGKYTDATFFEYSPEALSAHVENLYWTKLVDPYVPLAEIPGRDAVIAGQKRFALGSLIDGAWAHRSGVLGRYHRRSEAMLYAVHADEMGRGEVPKNHIQLIGQVLASMGVTLPHIRTEEFLDQRELPDGGYRFAVYQLCLALFPDSRHPEILGYNLGIEMFGLGALRLHEKQKLAAHGFDVSYEEAHLAIDNLSAGHARQAVEAIDAHLDLLRRDAGADVVAARWRRIWRGYASFALFVEERLVRRLMAGVA